MTAYLPEDMLNLKGLNVWSVVGVNIVTDEEYIMGFLAFVSEPGGIRIVFLYVLPEYRRIGVADRMLDELAIQLREAEYSLPVTMFLTGDAEQKAILNLLAGRGDFFVNPSSDYIIVSPEQIMQSDYIQKLLIYDSYADLLFDKPVIERRRIYNTMMESGILFGDDILTDGTDYIRELCYCNTVDGHINALCLVREATGKQLELSFVYAIESKGLAAVLSCLAKHVRECYPEHSIAISVVNENSRKLAEGFFKAGQCEHHTVYCAIWNGLLREELEDIFTEEKEV